MKTVLNDYALNQLFYDARSFNGWHDQNIDKKTLVQLWNLTRMGPTSANSSPMRVVFVITRKNKEKLRPCLIESNVEKAMTASAVAIIGHDMAFAEMLPKLFPHTDAQSWFEGNDELTATTAFRNGTLQGAYLMLAARALGIDCGPMSGFNNDLVDATFFKGTDVKSNFLCCLGHGDSSSLFKRSPRLEFDDACKIV
ncbi:MAG: malonic semialdehyde reductase [Magnetovibrio sp.]|nr:malonic semialdehyde reductase [Magnetovibrio sp.]|tara:strand:+ start:345 stop:935 length:591 start_codon:yes stop_codon:yes gene_type:complete